MTSGEAREEIRGAFVALALEARQEVARYGRVMAAADVHKRLLARMPRSVSVCLFRFF